MHDRTWMINVDAVRIAKKCVQIVRDELGVKLLLSNPDFIHLLSEYAELTESKKLNEALSELLTFANDNVESAALNAKDATVVKLRRESHVVVESAPAPVALEDETIMLNGKAYQRWRNGKEFKGLYRGQPTYR